MRLCELRLGLEQFVVLFIDGEWKSFLDETLSYAARLRYLDCVLDVGC